MQTAVQRDTPDGGGGLEGASFVGEMVNFSDEGDSRLGKRQKDQQRKLSPEEREARKQRIKEQRRLEKQQRKELERFREGDLVLMSAPEQLQQLPPASVTEPSPGVSSVTFASDDMLRTEAVSLQRIVIVGDLSCMKDDFIPAPAIPNADIKYLRNDVYGLENSFLEAEYHCRQGFELRYPNANGNNSNLICRKSRWIGKRPSCVRIKRPPLSLSPSSSAVSASASSSPSPASSLNEAATFVTSRARENNGTKLCGKKHNCQQACFVKDDNVTRVCSCFKGFKMVDGRNDVYGLENSFLEAEYHCRQGFELRYPNANGNNSNLICRKSRWIGKRPSCVRIKRPPLSLSPSSSAVSASASSSPSPASSLNEAATFVTSRARENNGTKLCGKKHNCQQACFVKDDNVTRVCSCFKGFKMVDGRCVEKFQEDFLEESVGKSLEKFVEKLLEESLKQFLEEYLKEFLEECLEECLEEPWRHPRKNPEESLKESLDDFLEELLTKFLKND
ncbi:hypothetical protein RP20_CCG024889 [Aedes albopictus]|nr:hypothetical protein RP20_CCG024889 [Aedes albopictus]